jgi:signal transduction histidine kinase
METQGVALHTAGVHGDRWTWAVFGVTTVIALGASAMTLTVGDRNVADDAFSGPALIVGSALIGTVVLRRQPGHGAGVALQVGAALFAVDLLAQRWWHQAVVDDPGSLPGAGVAAWLDMTTAPPALGLLVVAPVLLFPDGIARTRWLRRYVRAVAVASAAAIVAAGLIGIGAPATDLIDHPGVHPSGRGAVAQGIAFTVLALLPISLLVGLVSLVIGAVRARGEQRRRYTTVLAGGVLAVASVPVVTALGMPEWTQTLGVLILPVSLGVAIVRYRLYDIEVIIARVAVSATVAAACLAVYLGAVAATGKITGRPTTLDAPAVIAAVAVVAILAPLARLGQQVLQRWLYGARSDSAGLTLRLGEQVASGIPGSTMLSELAQTVASELRLGGLALEVVDGSTVSIGEPSAGSLDVPLVHRGERVGTMRPAPRRNERFTVAELEVIHDTGRMLGIAVGAIQLSDELAAARTRERDAHVTERQRVRVDLHDGLGPTLASIRMGLAAAARNSSEEPTSRALEDLRDRTADAIRELRRIVDGLAPSVVEDLGLTAALQLLVDDMGRWVTEGGPTITMDSDGHAVPAATSVAIYRIASEALSNACRHSHARHCHLSLTVGDTARLVVTDDGVGFDPEHGGGGAGMRSVHDRAIALGGTVTIESSPGAGTTVTLLAPLPVTEQSA